VSAIHHDLSPNAVANPPQARSQRYASLARETLFFTLCVAVAVAPLLQGLYAARERFIVMALVFVCTVGVLALSGRSRTISVAVLGGASLFVLYAVGLVTPASATGAINGFVVMAASVAMFWAWSSSDLKGQAQLQLGAAIVCSALLVAIWGLLTHIGLLAGDAVVGGRLAVGFGYPNATASWLGLGFVLSIMFPRKTLSWAGAVAFDFSAVLIGAALLFTGSRGAWLAVAVALGIGFVTSRRYAGAVLGQCVTLVVTSLVASIVLLMQPATTTLVFVAIGALAFGLLSGLARKWLRLSGLWLSLLVLAGGTYIAMQLWQGNNYTLSNHGEVDTWSSIRLGVAREVLGNEVTFTANVLTRNPEEKPFAGQLSIWATKGEKEIQRLRLEVLDNGERVLELPLTLPDTAEGLSIILVNVHANTSVTMQNPRFLLADGGEYIVSDLIYRVLPNSLAVRAQGLALERLVDDGRRQFIADALLAARQAPFFGRGGGTWQAVYSSFQGSLYGTARVHSDYVEVLLDIGLVGLVAYLLFLAIAIGPSVVSARSTAVERACAVGALTVFVHSGWEALLSFPSIYLGAFALIGAVQNRALLVSPRLAARIWLAVRIMSLAAFFLTLSLAAAEFVAQSGDSKPALVTALKLNPWNAARHVELAAMMEEDGRQGERATTHYEVAKQLEPYSAVYTSLLGQHYARTGNLLKAVGTLMSAIDLQPMNVVHYNNAARVAAHTAEAFYYTSTDDAKRYANKVLEVYFRLTQILGRADERWLRENPTFRLNPALAVDVGRALAMVGKRDESWRYLMVAAEGDDGSLFVIANPWLDRMFGYTFRPHEARNLLPTTVSFVARNQGFLSHRAALQLDSDISQVGAASLRGVASGAGLYGIGTHGYVHVSAGQTYTASVYVRHAPVRPVMLRIDWFSDASRTGFAHGTHIVAGDAWQRIIVTGIAPDNTTRLRLFVLTDNSAQQGDTMWVDAWMVEQGSRASPWVPGQFR